MSFVDIERDFIRERILPSFDWVRYPTHSPVNALKKPLAECRVALVATAGAHLTHAIPFDIKNPRGDPSYRVIPGEAPLEALRLSHGGYDTRRAEKDKNCVFPLKRLRELAKEGVVGSVSPRHFSFMGYIPIVDVLLDRTAREVAWLLKEDEVDLALLVPA